MSSKDDQGAFERMMNYDKDETLSREYHNMVPFNEYGQDTTGDARYNEDGQQSKHHRGGRYTLVFNEETGMLEG